MLIFSIFEPKDAYKKNAYKKNCVYFSTQIDWMDRKRNIADLLFATKKATITNDDENSQLGVCEKIESTISQFGFI